MPPNQIATRKRPSGTAQAAPSATAPAAPAEGGAPAQQKPAAPAAAQPGAPQTSQPAAGTGFVNLQRVLDANRGGGERMGQQLVQGVQAKGQAAQQAQQAAQGAFTAASAAKVLQYDPTTVNAGYKQAVADYSANPTQRTPGHGYTEDPMYKAYVDSASEGIARGKALAATSYEGPKSWEDAGIDVAGLTAQAQRAQEEAAALGTNSGRSALLSQQYGGPRSSGASALDAALVGNAVGGQAQDVASSFSGLTDMLAKARDGAGATYDTNKATSDANAAKYGTDAAKLETLQQQNKAELDAADRNRRWTADGGGPQMPILTPIPKPGGGFTAPTVPNPYNTSPEPTTWPAPRGEPQAPRNPWGGINWYNRRAP